MNRQPPSPSLLAWLLEQEAAELESLAAMLEQESRLLVSRSAGELEALLEVKSLHVSELASLDRRREELFRQLELGEERQEVAASLGLRFPGRGLDTLWLKLASLAEKCQQLNRVNAAIVETGQRHLSQALHILRGEPQSSPLYGANGESTGGGNRRLLGQA